MIRQDPMTWPCPAHTEHWESVDWVRVYQSFGLLPDDVRDA